MMGDHRCKTSEVFRARLTGGVGVGGVGVYQKNRKISMEVHLCKTSEFTTRHTGGVGVGAVGVPPQKFGKGEE